MISTKHSEVFTGLVFSPSHFLLPTFRFPNQCQSHSMSFIDMNTLDICWKRIQISAKELWIKWVFSKTKNCHSFLFPSIPSVTFFQIHCQNDLASLLDSLMLTDAKKCTAPVMDAFTNFLRPLSWSTWQPNGILSGLIYFLTNSVYLKQFAHIKKLFFHIFTVTGAYYAPERKTALPGSSQQSMPPKPAAFQEYEVKRIIKAVLNFKTSSGFTTTLRLWCLKWGCRTTQVCLWCFMYRW